MAQATPVKVPGMNTDSSKDRLVTLLSQWRNEAVAFWNSERASIPYQDSVSWSQSQIRSCDLRLIPPSVRIVTSESFSMILSRH